MEPKNRVYNQGNSAVFYRVAGSYGGLSNMAGGYPIVVGDMTIGSSEALYQICRFPYHPDIQRIILGSYNALSAKRGVQQYKQWTRPDWYDVRVRVMRWAIRAKLLMHFDRISAILHETGAKPIVEQSSRDGFWGAIAQRSGELVGQNVLGRLWMELRSELNSLDARNWDKLEPPELSDFLLLGKPILELVRPSIAASTKLSIESQGQLF